MLGYWLLYGGWRWLFWTLTIMCGINLALFIFCTQETYAPYVRPILEDNSLMPA